MQWWKILVGGFPSLSPNTLSGTLERLKLCNATYMDSKIIGAFSGQDKKQQHQDLEVTYAALHPSKASSQDRAHQPHIQAHGSFCAMFPTKRRGEYSGGTNFGEMAV